MTEVSTEIEYKIRPVTRYIVTRFEKVTGPGDNNYSGSEECGEFLSKEQAYKIGHALCRVDHQRLGYDAEDMRIQYPRMPE